MTTALILREPTGKPSWPCIHLTGAPKMGKSWSMLEFSAVPWVGEFILVQFGGGENTGDEYGAIPGARFKIADTTGTYADLVSVLTQASALPRVDPDKPNTIGLDGGTALWELLTDEQNIIARRRAASRVGKKYEKPSDRAVAAGDVEADITSDQWNVAAARWNRVMRILRNHDGPTFITSRMDEVMVMDGSKPTTQKEWKSKVHKSTRGQVTGTVEYHQIGKAILTGMRSVTLGMMPEDTRKISGFTLAGLLDAMGISPDTVGRLGGNEANPQAGADEMVADERAETQRTGMLPEREIEDAVKSAHNGGASSGQLRALANSLGDPRALSQVVVRLDGASMDAATALRRMIADAEREEREADQHHDAQQQRHGAQDQPAAAPIPAPAAPQGQDPQAVQDAHREANRDVVTKANLIAEINQVLVPQVSGMANMVAAFLDRGGATSLAAAPTDVLARFVRQHREAALAGLRRQGLTSQAQAYEQVIARNVVAASLDVLLGAGREEPAGAPAAQGEPVYDVEPDFAS